MIRTHVFPALPATDAQQEEELTAEQDLLAAVGFTHRMYKHATSRPLGNYFTGVMADTQLYRGDGTDLGPLTSIYASNVKPDFRPLDRRATADAFTLQKGKYSLPEADKGQQVTCNDLLGTAVAPPPAQPGAARISVKLGGSSEVKREKKAKKEKKEKKEKEDDKKRKR